MKRLQCWRLIDATSFKWSLLMGAAIWFMADSAIGFQDSNPQKRVLLLYSTRSDMLSNIVIDRGFRTILNDEFDVDVDVRSEYFDVSTQPAEEAMRGWLAQKYAGMPFDVVVTLGPVALKFASAYGRDIFEGSQIVYWGRRDNIRDWNSNLPLTGVVAPELSANLKATVELIYKLQPGLQRLFVVSGAAAADRRWETVARSLLPEYEDRFAVSYLSAPTLEDLQIRLSTLPRMTAILFLTMGEDGTGRRLLKSDVLTNLVQSASAPVYSTSAAYLDTGITGGALVDQETLAKESARLVVRILRGERSQDIPIQEGSITPTVNWRQLRLWNIPENRIPSGTVVIQKDPTVWEQYKWLIIATLLLCALQTALIVALLIHRTKRKRAEQSLSESKTLLQSAIDALNAQVVLLDRTGNVVAVNQAWFGFGQADCRVEDHNIIGKNYLEVCQSRIRRAEGTIVSGAIQDMISGARSDFNCIYESGQEKKAWLQLRMNRFYAGGKPWVVIAHENVTEIKEAHDAQRYVTGLLLRAQDEERRRIARDLHDVTVQNIAMIKAHITRVQKAWDNLDIKPLEKLKECLVLSDQVMKELRTLSYLLHPPLLDELGLVPALQWFIRGFIERSGIQVELSVSNNIGRLATDLETALFRVVQESLANIHRHSKSPDAMISVTRDEEAITLVIRDHGRGISKVQNHAISTPGVGIVGMGERLRQLGGQLDIQSNERGTIITARILTDTPAGKTATVDNA
jgi:two-component system, NarL family, sensor kinase